MEMIRLTRTSRFVTIFYNGSFYRGQQINEHFARISNKDAFCVKSVHHLFSFVQYQKITIISHEKFFLFIDLSKPLFQSEAVSRMG